MCTSHSSNESTVLLQHAQIVDAFFYFISPVVREGGSRIMSDYPGPGPLRPVAWVVC